MQRKIFLLTLLITAIGCASGEKIKKPDPAIKELNRVAVSIQSDLEKLSRLKQAEYQKVKLYDPPESGPLAKKITLSWSGPLDKALEVIAGKVGFNFRVRGKPPASPVLVNMDRMKTPVFEVLEDLGWKAGKHRVSVDAEKKVIQLTYFGES